jgi:F0F1-type ATP synthase assembly protein I
VSAQWKAAGSYGTIGLELVLCLMIGLFGGRWLDGKWGTEPWLTVVGFCFGLAAGAKAIHRGWKEMQAVTAQEEREEGNPQPRYDPDEGKGDKDDEDRERRDIAPDDRPE